MNQKNESEGDNGINHCYIKYFLLNSLSKFSHLEILLPWWKWNGLTPILTLDNIFYPRLWKKMDIGPEVIWKVFTKSILLCFHQGSCPFTLKPFLTVHLAVFVLTVCVCMCVVCVYMYTPHAYMSELKGGQSSPR